MWIDHKSNNFFLFVRLIFRVLKSLRILYIYFIRGRDFFPFWYLSMQIPELDFEIPPEAQRGSLSTVSPATLF